jgi:hypothetical protein
MPLFVDVLFIQWLGGENVTAIALDMLVKAQVQVIRHIEVYNPTTVLETIVLIHTHYLGETFHQSELASRK